MTLPYPDSPATDENIGSSIERIKDNFNYLDGLIGSGNIKVIVSSSVELATKSGDAMITGVGFQPKAMLAIATFKNGPQNSWGCATQFSTTTSVNCNCISQDSGYGGVASGLNCIEIYQTSTSYVVASVSTFNDDGGMIKWTKTLTPSGKVADIMYIFFG
jgi:hypothetical protein